MCFCKINSYIVREANVIYYIHILLGSKVISSKQGASIYLLPRLVQSNIKKKRLSDEPLLFICSLIKQYTFRFLKDDLLSSGYDIKRFLSTMLSIKLSADDAKR